MEGKHPSSDGRSFNSSVAVAWKPGKQKSGSISARGAKTKDLRWARGWGKVRNGESILMVPRQIRSMSMTRGSLITPDLLRPRSLSIASSSLRKSSGIVSLDTSNDIAAFTKQGDPSGQSTGSVFQSEDLDVAPCAKPSNARKAC